MADILLGLYCGSKVMDGCFQDQTNLVWTEEAAYQLLVNHIVDLSNVGLRFALAQLSSDLSPNLKRAMNALRCMVNAFGNNAWTWVAAAYWAIVAAGLQHYADKYLGMIMEMVCTCTREADQAMGALESYGLGPSQEDLTTYFGTCSEAAADL